MCEHVCVQHLGMEAEYEIEEISQKKVLCPSFPITSAEDCQSPSVCYIEFVLLALHTLGELH